MSLMFGVSFDLYCTNSLARVSNSCLSVSTVYYVSDLKDSDFSS
jgi:hypothetical protein